MCVNGRFDNWCVRGLDGRVPVEPSRSPQGRPEVVRSHVAVCEPESWIRVSRLMGTLLSYIRQYVCTKKERAHNSEPSCFILLCRWLTADTGVTACCETSDGSASLIEQLSVILITIFRADLTFGCSHREADNWFEYLLVSLTYKRAHLDFWMDFLNCSIVIEYCESS